MTPPTRYALVPVDLTPAMHNGLLTKSVTRDAKQHVQFAYDKGWSAALAASPNGGAVTAEMLERAAEYVWNKDGPKVWHLLNKRDRAETIAEARDYFIGAGLQVDAPAGEVVDG